MLRRVALVSKYLWRRIAIVFVVGVCSLATIEGIGAEPARAGGASTTAPPAKAVEAPSPATAPPAIVPGQAGQPATEPATAIPAPPAIEPLQIDELLKPARDAANTFETIERVVERVVGWWRARRVTSA